MQVIKSPIDYDFIWTDDGWYSWDQAQASKLARADRDGEVKRLRAAGFIVRPFSLSKQLITKGGIGSGHPHLEFVVSCYGYNLIGRERGGVMEYGREVEADAFDLLA